MQTIFMRSSVLSCLLPWNLRLNLSLVGGITSLSLHSDPLLVSAGFDAAEGDELGECHVSPAGYAHMTHMLSGLAGGKVVVALEVCRHTTSLAAQLTTFLWQGGYNLDSISKSALAVTRVLLGQAPDELPPMVASEEATETVWLVAKQQSKYWKSIDAAACEPREGEFRTALKYTVFSPSLLQRLKRLAGRYLVRPLFTSSATRL